MSSPQLLIAHRGASGLAPENTLKAFRLACETGADVLECDVRLTKDDQLVVIHDSKIERTTNGKGRVRRFTLEQIRQFDAGDGEKIPTLTEVVDLALSYEKHVIIEIKGTSRKMASRTAEEVVDFILEHDLMEHVTVYSFWSCAVKVVKKRIPNLIVAKLYSRFLRATRMLRHVQKIGADGVSIAHPYLATDITELARECGLFVDSWVLNDASTFDAMQEMGVRGLITDYPAQRI